MMNPLIDRVSVNHLTVTLVSEAETNPMTVKEAAKMSNPQEIITLSRTIESNHKTTTEELFLERIKESTIWVLSLTMIATLNSKLYKKRS
jgi:hypothetical protein